MAGKQGNITPWIMGAAIVGAVIYMRRRSQKAAYMLGIRVRIAGVKFTKDLVQLEMKIQNPNTVPVTVRSVVGDLYVNNERLGNVSKFGSQVIAGNSENSFYLDVRPKAIAVFNSISQLNMEKITLTFRFNGSVNINNKSVPMNIIYRYQPIPDRTVNNLLNLVKTFTGKK